VRSDGIGRQTPGLSQFGLSEAPSPCTGEVGGGPPGDGLVSRFRSSPEFAARSEANLGIEGH